MADPYNGQDDPAHRHPAHHEKSNPHQCRNRNDDRQFRFHQHAFSLYKGFQVLFVHFSADKPVMELLRTSGKIKQRHQEKGHGRKDRQNDPYTSAAQTDASNYDQDYFLYFHSLISSFPVPVIPEAQMVFRPLPAYSKIRRIPNGLVPLLQRSLVSPVSALCPLSWL